MIDYLAVMLVTVGIGLALLACYLYLAPSADDRPTWGAAFLATGLLMLASGVPMIVTWPLPGSYNIAFGEPAVLFGFTYAAAGLALLMRQDVLGPAIFGFFAGIVSIIVGGNLIGLHMTKEPGIAGASYIAAGVGGLLTPLAVAMRKQRAIVLVTALVLAIGAVLWLYTGFSAYPGHLVDFAKYAPK